MTIYVITVVVWRNVVDPILGPTRHTHLCGIHKGFCAIPHECSDFGEPKIGSTTARTDDRGDGVNCHHLFLIDRLTRDKDSTQVLARNLFLFFLGAVVKR